MLMITTAIRVSYSVVVFVCLLLLFWGEKGGGGERTFCVLITAKKSYKHCLIFMESKSKLSLMAPDTALHHLWTGLRRRNEMWLRSERSPSHQVSRR